MSRRRKSSWYDVFRPLAVLLFLGVLWFIATWNSLPPDRQLLIGILSGGLILSGTVFVVLWMQIRKRQRKAAWQKAMSAWRQSVQDGKVIENDSVRHFTPAGLERFSAQLFEQMGYKVVHAGQSGDHGVDVHLTNPLGQVELVQCKQWNKPVGEPEVRDLVGAMVHEKAVRGYLLAPNGFSEPARHWARGKRVVLADQNEIGRMVESAYGGKK